MKNRLDKKGLDALRLEIASIQGHVCPICRDSLEGKKLCLDHNHKTGLIRSVLCVNCNGIEGKVFNLANRAKKKRSPKQWVANLLEYWIFHETFPRKEIHPNHKTEEEKRLLRNKRARIKRKREKGVD